jgi:hypothetical protein
MKTPKVSRAKLLDRFETMCTTLGKQSRGFDVDAINGVDQWAMRKKAEGWMIVCGLGGCGSALTRWNGYVATRWSLLMLIEAVTNALEQDARRFYHERMRRLRREGKEQAECYYCGVLLTQANASKDDAEGTCSVCEAM